MDETQNQNTQAPQEPSKKQTNIMALISYIGPLCLIPLLIKDKDEFVRFHAKQGLVIFVGEVITWMIVGIIPALLILGNIMGIIWLVLSIVGIMNVMKNEKKELPVIGKYADKFKV